MASVTMIILQYTNPGKAGITSVTEIQEMQQSSLDPLIRPACAQQTVPKHFPRTEHLFFQEQTSGTRSGQKWSTSILGIIKNEHKHVHSWLAVIPIDWVSKVSQEENAQDMPGKPTQACTTETNASDALVHTSDKIKVTKQK